MLDQAAALETAQRYAQAVVKEFHPASVILFGSFAKGTAREDSDIDVAVIFDGYDGNWLEDSAKLWHLTWNISVDIEPILLDRKEDASGFVKEVCRTGKVLYSA